MISRCVFLLWFRVQGSRGGFAAFFRRWYSRIVKANTGYVEKKNNDGQSLPLVGKVASKASRIGQWRYEREWEMRLKPAIYENTRVPPQKEANPASLRSAAPSKGRGSRGHSLLPMEGGAPKGRRLDGGKRYERERGRSSQVRRLREHPIHRLPKRKPTPSRCARQPLPREGARVEGTEVGWGKRYKKEEESSKVDDSRKHPLQTAYKTYL